MQENQSDLLLEQAYQYEAAGKLTKALQTCEQIIALKPELAETYNLKGIILEQFGQQEDAVLAYKQAVTCDPDFGEAGNNLAELRSVLEEKEAHYFEMSSIKHLAGWGAVSFSITFITFNIIQTFIFIMSVTNTNGNTIVTGSPLLRNFLLALAIMISLFVIGNELYDKGLQFGLVGATTFFLVQVIARIFIWPAITLFFPIHNWMLATTITLYVIPATAMGIALGLVLKDSKLAVWLAIFSGISFAVYRWIDMWLYPGSFTSPLLGLYENAVRSSANPYFTEALVFSIHGIIVGIVGGGIIGATIGGIIGWRSSSWEWEEEETDDPRFQTAVNSI